MTHVRALAAALVAVIVLAPFAMGSAQAAGCSAVAVEPAWTMIEAPAFSTGSVALTSYAVDPYSPQRLWVSNGSAVLHSADGGCSWDEIFTLELLPSLEVPISSVNSNVRSIVVPQAPGAPNDIYLLIDERVGPVSRPHVIVSKDGGEGWRAQDEGLPLIGTPVQLSAAPSDTKDLYLLTHDPANNSRLFATTDGGSTWEERGTHPAAMGFDIDDLNSNDLWIWGGNGLDRSGDGGRNAANLKYVAPPVVAGDVFHAPGKPARMMALELEGPAFARTDDDGKTWRFMSAPPGHVVSLGGGPSADGLVMSMHKGVYRFQAPSHWVEITREVENGELPDDYEELKQLSSDRTASPSMFGLRSTGIAKYTGFSLELPPLKPIAPPANIGGVTLTPEDLKVELEPGDSETVTYDLGLPPQPTPLDVFFLVDTTESMGSSIMGLIKGIHRIVDDLSAQKIDVQFGVGEYKDYPIAGFGNPVAGDFPYRLNRAIGPADDELVDAMTRMMASGGGDVPESQLTALMQAASGSGEDPWVAPGQQAGFRAEALKVIVHITDAPFHKSLQHPSPPMDAVLSELSDQKIHQVGVAVWGWEGRPAMNGARADMEVVAKALGTVAPRSGVDCDGDGEVDRLEGEPLVCEVRSEEEEGVAALAPPIIATLRAVTDKAPVRLEVTKGEALVGSVEPALLEEVDVKKPNDLKFAVTYSCADASKGDVELVATVRGAPVASATARVVCKVVTLPALKVPEPKAPLSVVPAAPVPEVLAAVAPVPIPLPPPAPVPNAQPQPQPHPHVQGAAAHQEQEQMQVALAGASHAEAGEEYAFSRYDGGSRRSNSGAGLMLFMSAATLSAGFAALSLRVRRRVEHVRYR